MTQYRSGYRAAVKAAIAADPAFAGVTWLSAWAQKGITPASLPVIGVATPGERSKPASHGTFEKGTLLLVQLKREGGADIEDLIDEDGAAIERVVITALQTRGQQCLLEEISTSVNDEGARRIGTVSASFRVTSWRALPTTQGE